MSPQLQIHRKPHLAGEIIALMPDGFEFDNVYEQFSHSANGVVTGHIDEEQFVIKPFLNFAGEKMDREAMIIRKLTEAGIPTVNVRSLLFAKFANYLVTDYEHDVIPLDQLFDEGQDKEKPLHLAQEMGQMLGNMHGNLITHGDFRLKNLFEYSNKLLKVLDFESAQIHDDYFRRSFLAACEYDLETMVRDAGRHLPIDEQSIFEQEFRANYGHDQLFGQPKTTT